MAKRLKLTKKQKAIIDKKWDKVQIAELVREVWDDPSQDGRTREANVVKDYIAKIGGTITTSQHQKVEEVILTDEQKQYIENHCHTMSSVYIARYLFDDSKIYPLDRRCRAVQDYMREIDPSLVGREEEVCSTDYSPPKAFSRLLVKVNEATKLDLKEEDLSETQREGVETLARFLSYDRFLSIMNSYKRQENRRMMERTFVSVVYDKPDLTTEELNQYINLCMEYVLQMTINRQIEHLNSMLENVESDKELSIRLVEALNTKTKELDQCIKRQEQLNRSLVGNRADRRSKAVSENFALTSFFSLWKNEKEREIMLKMANQRRKLLKKEVDRIASLDDYLGKVQGLGYDELL